MMMMMEEVVRLQLRFVRNTYQGWYQLIVESRFKIDAIFENI